MKGSPAAALLGVALLIAMFLIVIPGATDGRSPAGFVSLAIGLALTLIQPISIPLTNTSVNPALSTCLALFVGGWALSRLWPFWVAPLLGVGIAGLGGRWLFTHRREDRSPGPISDPPVEMIVGPHRAND